MIRHRALAGSIVVAGVALMHAALPEARERVPWLYAAALPVSYGHLLGALSSRRAWPRRSSLEATFAASCVFSLFLILCWIARVAAEPLVFVPMLLVATWHVVENDLSLGRAYAGGLRLGRVRRDRRTTAATLAVALLLVGSGLFTPAGSAFTASFLGFAWPVGPLRSEDLLATFLLYHVVSWILFTLDRAQRLPPPAARALRLRLLVVHAAPVGVCAASSLWWPALYGLLTAPLVYLFWSAAHAFQTARWRGFEPA